jgi:hypothetical protein
MARMLTLLQQNYQCDDSQSDFDRDSACKGHYYDFDLVSLLMRCKSTH